MSRLITRFPRLWRQSKWHGAWVCLIATFLIVVSAISNDPPTRLIAAAAGPGFQLLSPTRLPNGAWRVSWSSTGSRSYQLQRTADDTLNTAHWVDVATVTATGAITFHDDFTSAPQRFYRVKLLDTAPVQSFSGDPGFFAPLGANGQPLEGAAVALGNGGLLPPFAFRPAGRSTIGLGQGFSIHFPAGARLLTIDGRRWIEFTSAVAAFGSRSPFQLRQQMSINGTQARLLPLDGLDVDALLAAFGLPAANGLEVTLFKKFPLRIVGGTFTGDGLRGSRVMLMDSALALPQGLNLNSNLVLDIEPDGSLRLPFSGTFGFDDSTGHGARLTVPTARPLWLELKADGGIALGGRVEVAFSPGPQFSADLTFDDPNYELSIAAKGLRFPLLTALGGSLPAAPSVPSTTNPAQLQATTERLRHFRSAITHFNAAVTAETPFSPDEISTHPAGEVARPTALLDAWSYTAFSGQNLSGAVLSSNLTNVGQSAAAARDIRSILETWAALQRLGVAASRGYLQLDASLQAELQEAINETAAALIARSKSPDAIRSMENMLESLRALLEVEKLRQQSGLAGFQPAADSGTSTSQALEVTAAIASLVNRFCESFSAELGVASGVFTPPAASRISLMDRPEVQMNLSQIAELIVIRQQLGLDTTPAAALSEAVGQLASQFWTRASAELTAAESSADGDSFTEVLSDTLGLVRWVDTGLVPSHPSLAGLPNSSSLPSLFARWKAVLDAEMNRIVPAAAGPAFTPAIVGGTRATQHIPYQAALTLRSSNPVTMPPQQFCGGSILNARWILTAAHCVSNSWVEKDPSKLGVLVGVTNLNQVTPANYYEADQILTHPFYETNVSRWDYDVALIHLNRDIDFEALNTGALRAQPLRLLSSIEGLRGEPALGSMARASGWGHIAAGGPGSVDLLYADVPIATTAGLWPAQDLRSRYLLAGYLNPVPSSVCQGDSGGPLVFNGKQVGVVSFVKPCAVPGYPDIYMRVSSFEPWISAQAGLTVQESPAKLAKLLKFYRDVVATATATLVDLDSTPAIRYRCERAEALVASLAGRPNESSLRDILATLRLGSAHARLRDLIPYDNSRWWEGFAPPGNGYVQTNLIYLTKAAALKLPSEPDWAEVLPTIDALLAEADHLGTLQNRASDRHLYLQAARLLLDGVRTVGGSLYETYAARVDGGGATGGGGAGIRPASVSGANAGDVALPGELRVHKVAGSARYNRATHAFSASFSGELELAGFELRLAVPNASIASGGFFDLSVHGQVGLPPGNSQARLIIPSHRPVHISLRPSGQVQFSGAGRLELNNGMAFEAFLQAEDPLYRFGLSAQGIRFDVGDRLKVMVPTLPDGRQFAASAARDLNDYFRSLSATIDGVVDTATLPSFREPSQPPEFTVPTAVVELDAVEAWANAQLADVHLNLNRDYSSTLDSIKQNLKTLASALRDRRGEISPEELEMRLRTLGKVCAAVQARRAAGQTAEADAIANAPEFLEFRQETEEAVLALLQRAPTRDGDYQDATVATVDRYLRIGTCFDPTVQSRIVGALSAFQQELWNVFASQTGISRTSGLLVDPSRLPLEDPRPFRPFFLRYAKLSQQHQTLGLSAPASAWVDQVGQTLAMRWRSSLLGQLRPLSVDQAESYTQIGFLTRDLILLLCSAQQGVFDYPAGDIEQLQGPPRPYDYPTELRNTYRRLFDAQVYVLTVERASPGHVDKVTTETQPAFNILAAHLKNIDTLVCKLREPRDPVSQFLWNILSADRKEELQNFRPSTFALTVCDITDPPAFADLLSGPKNLVTDRLTLFLWNQFSGEAQEVLTNPSASEDQRRLTITRELNAVIKGPSIYDAARFNGIGLTQRTLALRDQNPAGAALVRFNRWLLDDAFPAQVARSRDEAGTTAEGLKIGLANELYELIQGQSIYTAERFAGVRLSPETEALRTDPNPDHVRWLNRRLLEDAYPEELPRADVSVFKTYFPALDLLRLPIIEDPIQCGLDYGGDTASEREILQVADEDFLDQRLTAAETRLLQTGTAGDLQGALKLLKELIWLAGWAEKKQLPGLPRVQTTLGRLTIEFTAAAHARKAWWYLHEYTDILLTAAESSFLSGTTAAKAAVLAEANNALRTGSRLLNSFKFLLPGQRPIDLPLPGEIYINRVFGEIQYRRDTGQLSGRFGGRIEFPDLQNAFFEVTEATLNSDLQFHIQAGTGGPLPFNGVFLTAAINATGGRNLPLDFTGSGTVTVTNGPQFNAVVSWNGTNRTLSFNSQASQLQSLRFTDNLVLFDAGFGFTVRPDSQSGELRANGSAGFFARNSLPENVPITRTNFHLFAENIRAALAYQPGRIDLTFSNGTLLLPALFYPTNFSTLCPGAGAPTGPSIALNPANPIRATFLDGATPSVGFQGELNFHQFGVQAPGLPGLAAALCSARLKFSSSELPYLTNVTGSLQIPIPNQTNNVDLLDGVFTLAGYPSGRLQLRKDLTLLNLDGFKFVLLGQGNPACPAGSGLTVYPSTGFNEPPSFRVDGGIKVIAPLDMLTGENGDEAFGLACGSLDVRNGALPALDVQALQFGGTFHLGSGGPIVRNALISLEGIPNLFSLDSQHQFLARIEGRLQIPSGPEFILQDARFTFFDPNRLPKFSVAGLGLNNANFTLMNYLPAQVTRAELHFKAPLAEVPDLFAPTNVIVLLSAAIRFPATGTPMLAGAVEQLEVEFNQDGIPRVKNLDALEMGIAVMKMPPIREIGGRVRIGGLSSGDQGRIYLLGRIGGSYQGYTVIGQFAANLSGPLGFCIDVNAGAAGIPIGPTGILITGASGGESFVNSNGDPCEFTSYFSRDANGNLTAPSAPTPPGLGMTWEAFRDVVERMEQQAQVFADNVSGSLGGGVMAAAGTTPPEPDLQPAGTGSTVNLPCPGDCPPPTVNIFCQPHPDQALYAGKIIAKFSSINETTLNQLGITQARIQALGGNLTVIAGEVAHAIRTNVANLTPPPDPALLGPQAAAALAEVMASSFNTIESTFSNLCWQALGSPQAGEGAYQVIRRLAYEGLPCPDVTMTVAGNLSYAGVSSMAYISGKGIVSTAGAAGVIGTVYVFGVPLGQARVFVAATDDKGDPNPSICGQAVVGFGPIDLGNVKLSYACPGCVTGVLGGIPEVLAALSDPLLRRIAGRVQNNSTLAALPRADLINALLTLPDAQKLGIFAELANEPLSTLPPNLPQVFFQGIADLYDAIQPEFAACGEVRPKIFGLPLGDAAVSAQVFATKTEVAGAFQFSPSYLIGAYLPVLPGGDSASLSFAYQMADPYAFLFGGLGGNFAPDRIASYTQSAIDSMLQNTTFAVSYEIHPFGLELASAAGRVILPDLTSHPVLPWRGWVRPEERGNPNLPSRHDLLLAALASDRLGNAVNWRGTTNDLFTIYPSGSPQRAALTGLSLSKDYFPHGGVLGAARVTLPAMLTEKPPLAKLNTVLDAQAVPLDRLVTAIDLIQNYVLRFNTNGALGFYVPAPNPPIFYDLNGRLAGASTLQGIVTAKTPQDILESIKSFDVANIRLGNLYPIEQAFLRGYLDGELLGVPILRADAVGLPADANRSEGFLSVTSTIPTGSWLKQFIPQATLLFDARGVPPRPIEDRFVELLGRLQAARNTNASSVVIGQLINESIGALTTDLPKVRLTADLQAGLQMPAPISDLLAFSGGAHLHGFSPRYEPGYDPTNNSPLAQVRRAGGLAFQGGLRLKAGGITLVDIANGEVSVIPNGSGLPSLAARLEAQVLPYELLTFRDVLIDFATDPNPHFTAAGRVDPLSIGDFQLVPGLGSLFNGRLDVARTGQGAASVSARLGPARIVVPSLIGGVDTVLIHGITSSEPFTFSSTGNWSANLTVSSALSLGTPGAEVLRLNSADFQTLRFYGSNGLADATMEFALKPNLNLIVFPGQAFQRSITLSAGGALLRVNRNGTFELTDVLGGNLVLSGLPITSISAGASIRLTQDALTLTAQAGQMTGGALSAVPAGQAGGTITFGRDGTVTLNGAVTVAPFSSGLFLVESLQGGVNPISARLENGGLILSGARLLYRGSLLAVLPEISVQNNGDFTVTVGSPFPIGVTLGQFSLNNVTFVFRRTGGFLQVPSFSGNLAIPRLNRQASVSGTLSGFGTYSLTGILQSSVPLSGLPVTSLGAGAGVTLTESSLTVRGSVSGGTLSQFSPAESAIATLAITPATMTVSGSILVSPLNFGAFVIESYTGGSFPIHFGNGAITMSNIQLRATGILNSPLGLGVAPMQLDGGFFIPITLTPGFGLRNISGYPCSIASFTVRRQNGVVSIDPIVAALNFGGFNHTLTGFIHSDGQVGLDFNGATTFPGGWTLSGARLHLDSSGLTASGNVSVNGLGTLALDGSVSTDGGYTISQQFTTQGFYGFPVVNASYTLSRPAGQAGSLAAGLQLNLPGLSGPRFAGSLATNGTFTLQALNQALALAGFGMTDVDFTLSKPGSGAAALFVDGSLNLPGFSGPINNRLNGTITTGGSINLNWGGTLTLGVFNLGSGSLALRDNGLFAHGTLGVSGLTTLTLDGEVQPNGAFSLSQGFGTQNFFGFPAQNVLHTFSAAPGGKGEISTRFNVGFGDIASLTFEGGLNTSGAAQLRAAARAWTIGAFALTNLTLSLDHSAGAPLASLSASANLFFGDFSQALSGSFGTDGSYSLRYSGGMTLGTFFAGNGALVLTNVAPRLRANGSFQIRIGTQTYNSSMAFAGSINNNGSYSLAPSVLPWSLNFVNTLDQGLSGFGSAQGATLTLTSSGLSGSGNFSIGTKSLPVSFSTFTSSTLSMSGSTSVDSGWVKVFGNPFGNTPGDVWTRAAGSLSLSADSGKANVTLGGDFGIYEFFTGRGGPDSGKWDRAVVVVPAGGTVSNSGRWTKDYNWNNSLSTFGRQFWDFDF